jgi:uncharacterized protein (TIGR02145 family)
MKKNLLLMMMCCPVILAAQNGVTVSGLAIDAGTVTFNVSWEKPMPVELWSDTVWVFVDYNKNGVMERLPLLPGATLTDTSPGGEVIEEAGNDQGIWVAGNARINGSFSATVQLLTAVSNIGGACVYGSNYPPVAEYASATNISFTGTPPYDLILNTGSGTTSVQAYSTYNLLAGQTLQSFTDKTSAPGIILSDSRPQGSCTHTEPVVVGTFAAFPNNYSYSTYVSLIDVRDNKIYPVVKIGGRWIMARNLNYQKDLTWRTNSNSPSTTSGGGVTALIGNFWCPGGYSSTTTISTRASCDVWGALYSWETAMMVDGKWTSSEHNSSAWSEPASYGTSTSSGNTQNHARSDAGAATGGRGICPLNWHVPTDDEWGNIINAMETGTKNHNTAINWIGTNAGARGKSKCTVANKSTSGNTYVNDTQANWYYESSTSSGTDVYGFRDLPTGRRNDNGSSFNGRGVRGWLWSSTAANDTISWHRQFDYRYATVDRSRNTARSSGHAVRCIRD